jgi:Ca-activated chloride channel homolog
MVPAAVALKRSKTASIILLAVATIVAALFLVPRGPGRRSIADVPVSPPPPVGDPCEVSVSSRLTSTHVLVGRNDEHLVVSLRAPSCGQNQVRAPLSLAIVLDRSGSMQPPSIPVADQPLTHAKRAAIQLLDQLEPTDVFSVVSYHDDAQVETGMAYATPEAKLAARRAIEAIFDGQGTNISAALELGQAQLGKSPLRDGIRRMVLISDGDATMGVQTVDGLTRIAANIAAVGTSITAVGLGLSYDEATMTGISAAGRGNYYFVADSTELGAMFAAELASLGKTVIADAALAIEPAPGVEIVEVFSYGAKREGAQWIVPIADLAAGETRKIVARVRVTAEARGVMQLATSKLTYRPVDAHQMKSMVTTAQAEITGDATVVRAGLDVTAVRFAEEAETARAITEASTVYATEGYAGAQRVLDARAAAAQAKADALGDPSVAGSSMRAVDTVSRDFAAAPAATGAGGSKAAKGASSTAYELAK